MLEPLQVPMRGDIHATRVRLIISTAIYIVRGNRTNYAGLGPKIFHGQSTILHLHTGSR